MTIIQIILLLLVILIALYLAIGVQSIEGLDTITQKPIDISKPPITNPIPNINTQKNTQTNPIAPITQTNPIAPIKPSLDYKAIPTSSINDSSPLITGLLYRCTNPSLSEYNNKNICNDISYNDPKTNTIYQTKGILDSQYYIDSVGIIKPVPEGNISSVNNKSYIPKNNNSINDKITYYKNIIAIENIKDSQILAIYQKQIENLTKQLNTNYNANTTSNTTYDSNNFDITYHANPETTQPSDISTAGVGKMWLKDNSGNLMAVPYSDVSNSTVYYQAGSYPFGPSSYVPNYEESVYLSKLTNQTTTSIIKDYAFQKAGFCQGTSLIDKEEKCRSLDKNVCASTECCVLLGGEKCVAGGDLGPTDKSNYSDFLITNRDFYYYKGKCYGNCS